MKRRVKDQEMGQGSTVGSKEGADGQDKGQEGQGMNKGQDQWSRSKVSDQDKGKKKFRLIYNLTHRRMFTSKV